MGNFKLAAFCVQHTAFLNEVNVATSSNLESSFNDINISQNHSVTQKAVVYAFLKSFSKAFNVLENELKLKPDRKTYNLLGKIYMEAKMWQDASGIFQRSIDFNVDCSFHIAPITPILLISIDKFFFSESHYK